MAYHHINPKEGGKGGGADLLVIKKLGMGGWREGEMDLFAFVKTQGMADE